MVRYHRKRHNAGRRAAIARFTSGAVKELYRRGKRKLQEYVKGRSHKKTRFTVQKQSGDKTKRSGNLIQGDDVHGGINTNSINLVLHKGLKHKAIGRWKFAHIQSVMFGGPAGAQGVTVLWGVNHKNQFTTDTANPSAIQISKNLFNLNINRGNTGSNMIPSLIVPAGDRFVVYHVTVSHMLTNMSTIPVVLYLYYVTPKRDSNVQADTAWGNACDTERLTVAQHISPAAGLYNTGATWGGSATTDWHNKPDRYRNWNTFFKILKVKKVVLAAGASQEIVTRIAVNKMVNLEQLNSNALDLVKGLTVDCLATVYGAAVNDITSGAAANVPTIGNSKVASVHRVEWTCGQVQDNAARLDDSFVYQQIPYNGTIANERQIDAVDAVTAVEQA